VPKEAEDDGGDEAVAESGEADAPAEMVAAVGEDGVDSAAPAEASVTAGVADPAAEVPAEGGAQPTEESSGPGPERSMAAVAGPLGVAGEEILCGEESAAPASGPGEGAAE
jgi:hypothetical protein